MRPHGKVSLGGLVLTLAVVAGLWGAILLLPVYADNMDVQKVVREAWILSSKYDDAGLVGEMNSRLRNVGTHIEDDGYGNPVVRPGLRLTPEQVQIDRDSVQGTVSVRVVYSREVRLSPLNRTVTLTFRPEMSGTPP